MDYFWAFFINFCPLKMKTQLTSLAKLNDTFSVIFKPRAIAFQILIKRSHKPSSPPLHMVHNCNTCRTHQKNLRLFQRKTFLVVCKYCFFAKNLQKINNQFLQTTNGCRWYMGTGILFLELQTQVFDQLDFKWTSSSDSHGLTSMPGK